METITTTELHDHTDEYTDRAVLRPDRPIVVSKRGKPAVVLVEARYFEGLIETIDVLSDKTAMCQVRRGLADLASGRVIGHDDLRKELGLDGRKSRRNRMGPNRSQRAAGNRKPSRPAKDRR